MTLLDNLLLLSIVTTIVAGVPSLNITLTPLKPFNISLLSNLSAAGNTTQHSICSLQYIDPIISDWLHLDGVGCSLFGSAPSPPVSPPAQFSPVTETPLNITILTRTQSFITNMTSLWNAAVLLVNLQWTDANTTAPADPRLKRPLNDLYIPLIRLQTPLLARRWSFRFPADTFTAGDGSLLPLLEYRILHAAAGKSVPDWLKFIPEQRLLLIEDLSVIGDYDLQSALTGGQLVRLRDWLSNRYILPLILVARNEVSGRMAYSTFYLSLISGGSDSLKWLAVMEQFSLPPAPLDDNSKQFVAGKPLLIPFQQPPKGLNMSIIAIRTDGLQTYSSSWLGYNGSAVVGMPSAAAYGRWNLTVLLSSRDSFGFRFPLDSAANTSTNDNLRFSGSGSLAIPWMEIEIVSSIKTSTDRVLIDGWPEKSIINANAVLQLGGKIASSDSAQMKRLRLGAQLPSINIGSAQNGTEFNFDVDLSGLFLIAPTGQVRISGLMEEPLPAWLTFRQDLLRDRHKLAFRGILLTNNDSRDALVSHSLFIRISPQTGGFADDLIVTLLVNGEPLPSSLSGLPGELAVIADQPFRWKVPQLFADEDRLLLSLRFDWSDDGDAVRFNNSDRWLSGRLPVGNFTLIFIATSQQSAAYSAWVLPIWSAPLLLSNPAGGSRFTLTSILILTACLLILVTSTALLIGFCRYSRMRREDWKNRFGRYNQNAHYCDEDADDEEGYIWEYFRYLASCACCAALGKTKKINQPVDGKSSSRGGKHVRRFSFSSFKLSDRSVSSASSHGETLETSSPSRNTLAAAGDLDEGSFIQMTGIDQLTRAGSNNSGVYLKSLKDGSITVFAEAGKAFHFTYPTERMIGKLEHELVPILLDEPNGATTNMNDTPVPTSAQSLLNGLSYISYPSTSVPASQLPSNFHHRVKLTTTANRQPTGNVDITSTLSDDTGSSLTGDNSGRQQVRFSARLYPSGHELPSWLHLNRKRGTFFGIPLIFDCGTWEIELGCQRANNDDGGGGEVSDFTIVKERFRLEVMEEII